MKYFSRFIYHATAYTVAVTMLFFAFAKLMGVESTPSVTFGRYALIFAFGLVLSASEYIFSVEKLSRVLRYFLHYAILAVAFFFVFLTVRKDSDTFVFNASVIFASIIIFSVFYLIGLGLVLLFKSIITDRKDEKKSRSKAIGKQKSSKR